MDKARLRNFPLFADLSDDDLEVVSAFATEKSVSEGDLLVREGDFSDEFVAIEDGTAEVLHGDEVFARLEAGDFFGEVGVMSKEMRSATVRATSGMRLLTMTTFDFKRIQKLPGVQAKIEEAVEARTSS